MWSSRWLISAKPAVGIAVDQFLGTGRRFDQDAEPGEGVLHEVVGAVFLRDRPFADAAGTVRADQDLGVDFLCPAVLVGEPDLRGVGGQVRDDGVGHRVVHFPAIAFAGSGEVDEHLVLRVEPDRFPDQVLEVDAVAHPAEPQVDALVLVAGLQHPVRDARIHQHVHAAVFEDAGPVGGADRLVVALLDHHVVDPGLGEQVRQHEARRAAADDSDFGGDDFRIGHSGLLVEMGWTDCAAGR